MDFYEFFAGGGMARLGLGPEWTCRFANDFDPKKADSYRRNFDPSDDLHVCDIANLTSNMLPDHADLAWASFPCQDLSLAGYGDGLSGDRSGTFWAFWKLMETLSADQRPPRVIVLENVYGAITSNDGEDLASICEAFAGHGYSYAPLVIDAQLFVPQSRPRLFIVAYKQGLATPPDHLVSGDPIALWHPEAFQKAYKLLSEDAKGAWIWLNMPTPPARRDNLVDIIEEEPAGVNWHSPEQTQRLLDMMTDTNLAKVEEARVAGRMMVGAVYKRTRQEADGRRRQRAEIRFDDVAGCLRTPSGGSSRQTIMIVDGDHVRSRLLSPREAARLMGLPEHYLLPDRYNDAYHLAGDGVVVPVVSWLSLHAITPSIPVQQEEAA